MAVIQLLHTADVHLDAPLGALGEQGSRLRALVREAFVRVIDAALEREVQLVIIAGDLFDTRTPAGATLDFALTQLGRLSGASPAIHVALLPGTHDCRAEGGLWDSPRITGLPHTVHVLADPEGATAVVPDFDLALHGCPHLCGRGGQRPVGALRASDDAGINVGVAHASFERGDVKDDSMFDAAEIAATGLDYLALGHWHSWEEHSVGDAVAVNPGSPEVAGFGEREPGAVALVTLGDGPARVERVPIGRLRAVSLEIEAGDLGGTEDLVARVSEHADPDCLLELTLTGLAPPGVLVETDTLRERLADDFFALRIRDESHPALEGLDAEAFDDRLTLGKFVELARQRIEAADDDRERRVAERALHIGVAMLADHEGGRA